MPKIVGLQLAFMFFIMQRKILVNRRCKEVLTKGAVIDLVIGLGAGAVKPLVAGLVVGVVKDLATGSKRLLAKSEDKIETKESCC